MRKGEPEHNHRKNGSVRGGVVDEDHDQHPPPPSPVYSSTGGEREYVEQEPDEEKFIESCRSSSQAPEVLLLARVSEAAGEDVDEPVEDDEKEHDSTRTRWKTRKQSGRRENAAERGSFLSGGSQHPDHTLFARPDGINEEARFISVGGDKNLRFLLFLFGIVVLLQQVVILSLLVYHELAPIIFYQEKLPLRRADVAHDAVSDVDLFHSSAAGPYFHQVESPQRSTRTTLTKVDVDRLEKHQQATPTPTTLRLDNATIEEIVLRMARKVKLDLALSSSGLLEQHEREVAMAMNEPNDPQMRRPDLDIIPQKALPSKNASSTSDVLPAAKMLKRAPSHQREDERASDLHDHSKVVAMNGAGNIHRSEPATEGLMFSNSLERRVVSSDKNYDAFVSSSWQPDTGLMFYEPLQDVAPEKKSKVGTLSPKEQPVVEKQKDAKILNLKPSTSALFSSSKNKVSSRSLVAKARAKGGKLCRAAAGGGGPAPTTSPGSFKVLTTSATPTTSTSSAFSSRSSFNTGDHGAEKAKHKQLEDSSTDGDNDPECFNATLNQAIYEETYERIRITESDKNSGTDRSSSDVVPSASRTSTPQEKIMQPGIHTVKIHQTWRSKEEIPRKFAEFMKSWYNAGKNQAAPSSPSRRTTIAFQHFLHTDEDTDQLARQNLPKLWYYKVWKNKNLSTVARTDFARILLLYCFGGIYLDLDVELVNFAKLEDLLRGLLVLRQENGKGVQLRGSFIGDDVVGEQVKEDRQYETEVPSAKQHDKLRLQFSSPPGIILGDEHNSHAVLLEHRKTPILSNAVLISIEEKHPFWWFALERMFEEHLELFDGAGGAEDEDASDHDEELSGKNAEKIFATASSRRGDVEKSSSDGDEDEEPDFYHDPVTLTGPRRLDRLVNEWQKRFPSDILRLPFWFFSPRIARWNLQTLEEKCPSRYLLDRRGAGGGRRSGAGRTSGNGHRWNYWNHEEDAGRGPDDYFFNRGLFSPFAGLATGGTAGHSRDEDSFEDFVFDGDFKSYYGGYRMNRWYADGYDYTDDTMQERGLPFRNSLNLNRVDHDAGAGYKTSSSPRRDEKSSYFERLSSSLATTQFSSSNTNFFNTRNFRGAGSAHKHKVVRTATRDKDQSVYGLERKRRRKLDFSRASERKAPPRKISRAPGTTTTTSTTTSTTTTSTCSTTSPTNYRDFSHLLPRSGLDILDDLAPRLEQQTQKTRKMATNRNSVDKGRGPPRPASSNDLQINQENHTTSNTQASVYALTQHVGDDEQKETLLPRRRAKPWRPSTSSSARSWGGGGILSDAQHQHSLYDFYGVYSSTTRLHGSRNGLDKYYQHDHVEVEVDPELVYDIVSSDIVSSWLQDDEVDYGASIDRNDFHQPTRTTYACLLLSKQAEEFFSEKAIFKHHWQCSWCREDVKVMNDTVRLEEIVG
ncbi:unnamed protein product [Amoebophrya sp. A120]|nr:unnamed protein product [Amoebophrya sp. A120]|eukprot:GSA120T00007259001.1